MSKKIICIYTDDTRPRRFVSATSKRFDHNLAAELTADPDQAHDFGSEENARMIIPRLHNPYERTYHFDQITVTRKAVVNEFENDIN